MLDIQVSGEWHTTFPGGHVGVLLVGNVDNRRRPTPLDARKREIAARLRATHAGSTRADLREIPLLAAYRAYYKRFKKTYHVQQQLESVALKGKSLPHVSPLVDANFAAELETLVLTAGHDADRLVAPLRIDVTQGGESFTQLSGTQRTLRPDDMLLADAEGIVCTIIYGQDQRTPITPATRRALYVAYAPVGVGETAVQQQLDAIWAHIQRFAPNAELEMQKIFSANS